MFIEISNLVSQQGEMITRIEDNVLSKFLMSIFFLFYKFFSLCSLILSIFPTCNFMKDRVG